MVYAPLSGVLHGAGNRAGKAGVMPVMRTLIALPIAVLLALSNPAAAQDFFKPLTDALEELSPRKPAPQREQRPAPAAEVPPQPRDRPAGLGEAPAEEEPADAAPEAAEDEAPVRLPTERPDEAEPDTPPEVEDPAPVTPPAETAKPEAEETSAAQAPEPARVYQTMCPAMVLGLVEAKMAAPIKDGECGERSPLAVTGVLVNGRMVPLSSEALVTCEMATGLPTWLSAVDNYLAAREETRMAEVGIGTSYACRNRNNADTGFMSEHGLANGLDVTGFTLEDGRSVGVEADWPKADAMQGRLLRYAHDAACSGFATVLGPEANAEHHDHLHLDMGCHGERCVARICE